METPTSRNVTVFQAILEVILEMIFTQYQTKFGILQFAKWTAMAIPNPTEMN